MSETGTPPLSASPDVQREAFLAAASEGNIDRIRLEARRFLARAASPARAARLVSGTMQKLTLPGFAKVRVALLSSFSIELVHDHLVAHGATEGMSVEIYHPSFDQYHQDVLDRDSGLYRFGPDIVVLAVDGARLAPEFYSGFLRLGQNRVEELAESAVRTVEDLIVELRKTISAPVLIHSLAYPRYPELGILDINHRPSQRNAIARINEGLAALSDQMTSVYLLDIEAMIQSVGYDRWHDPRLDFFARSSIARSAMDVLARGYLRYLRAIRGYSRKCVVVDLDNTLWGGILGEDGPRGIALGSEYPGNAYVAFQRALAALRDRGVILAIASKNDRDLVERAFAENPGMVLSLDQFSATEIHWEPKSSSIGRIAQSLNLDPRHIVFVDDNPAECAEVERIYPGLTTIALPNQPEKYVESLLAEGLFDTLAFSAEDARRADLYKQREEADRLRRETPSLNGYFRSLEMQVYLDRINVHNLSRVAQMTQKTNQFNATTKRYTEADINSRLSGGGWTGLTMRVVDKFGDNGIVGVLLAERKDSIYDIDSFVMSCRVINRSVETAMLHWLSAKAAAEGVSALEGRIIPTDRNLPVRDLYERHGFSAVNSDGAGISWRFELTDGLIAAPEWLQIIDQTKD